jgi:hypothetical protein
MGLLHFVRDQEKGKEAEIELEILEIKLKEENLLRR